MISYIGYHSSLITVEQQAFGPSMKSIIQKMGTVLRKGQVDPRESLLQKSAWMMSRGEVSRADFKFLKKIATSGVDEENTFWLAANSHNSHELFFVRQSSKIKIYNHKRVKAVLQEMKLMTQTRSPHLIKVLFAFQDHEFLYLVTQPIDSLPFQQVLRQHSFTQDQTRYVVSALISVLEEVHAQGYALTELSPRNIHFDRRTGQLKVTLKQGRNGSSQVMEMPSPAPIDSYCSMSPVAPICPYSAPEILYRGHVLAESDFYSIGVMIYEMMTHESSELSQILPKHPDRVSILKEEIQVEKSKIPEDWESESADFLIKVLVKNPALRIGRYGSFQLKNHPWLRAFDPDDHFRRIDFSGISLISSLETTVEATQPLDEKSSQRLIRNHCFQGLFESYSFRREPDDHPQSQSGLLENSILLEESNVGLQESSI